MYKIDREKLIRDNINIVTEIVDSYGTDAVSYDEMYVEGIRGLKEAATHFMCGKGRFTSYAPFWIKRRIGRLIKRKNRERGVYMKTLDELITENISIVACVLNSYVTTKDSNYEDYYQDGAEQLIKVVRSYTYNISTGFEYKTPLKYYINICMHNFYKRYFSSLEKHIGIVDIASIPTNKYIDWDAVDNHICLDDSISVLDVHPQIKEVLKRYYSNDIDGGNLKAVAEALNITYDRAIRYHRMGLRRLRYPSICKLYYTRFND